MKNSVLKESWGKMGKKRVLMTVQWIFGYSGSELHCLAMAEEFVKRGYDVTVATFKTAYPMTKKFADLGVQICSVFEPLPQKHYDILFAIHYPVANYLVSHHSVTFDRVAVCILSAFHPIEHFPQFAEDADVYSFVSKEALEHRIDCGLKLEEEKAFLFVNYADDSYFDAYSPKKQASLQKIAVVSNHVCGECLELKALAEEKGIKVDYLGVQFRSVSVTPQLLQEYDLVVTIGKTVQFCMAAGVPVYCYDQFGGSGYITPENFQVNKDYNFSGRGVETKRTAQELLTDMIDNYSAAAERLDWLYRQAEEHFSLTRLFDSFLEKLLSCPVRPRNYFDFYTDVQKAQQDALALHMPIAIGNSIGVAQVYEDSGEGFSEESSYFYEIAYQTEVELTIPVSPSTKALRFDPDRDFCRCRIFSALLDDGTPVICKPAMPFAKDGDWDFFFTDDGRYDMTIETEVSQNLTVKFAVGRFFGKDLGERLLGCFQENADKQREMEKAYADLAASSQASIHRLETEKEQLQNQISLMESSLSWKLTKPLRTIKKRFGRS